VAGEAVVNDFKIGDRVCYLLPISPAHGRHEVMHCAATVRNVTAKRVVLRLDKYPKTHRNALPYSLHSLCSQAQP
jgi:hypothetical protein